MHVVPTFWWEPLIWDSLLSNWWRHWNLRSEHFFLLWPTDEKTHSLSQHRPPSERPAPESSRERRPGTARRRPRPPAAQRPEAGGARRTAPPGPCWQADEGRSCELLLPGWRRAPPAEQRVDDSCRFINNSLSGMLPLLKSLQLKLC